MPITLTISVPTPGEAAQGATPEVSGPLENEELVMHLFGVGLMRLSQHYAAVKAKDAPLVVPAKSVPKGPDGGNPPFRIVS